MWTRIKWRDLDVFSLAPFSGSTVWEAMGTNYEADRHKNIYVWGIWLITGSGLSAKGSKQKRQGWSWSAAISPHRKVWHEERLAAILLQRIYLAIREILFCCTSSSTTRWWLTIPIMQVHRRRKASHRPWILLLRTKWNLLQKWISWSTDRIKVIIIKTATDKMISIFL